MANLLSTKTIIITVSMPQSFNYSAQRFGNGPFRLTRIYWFNPANVGDLATITDGGGNIITPMRCEVANQSQVFYAVTNDDPIQDFQVTEIDSGTLYITVQLCGN
jgi:hypothetical protein